MTPPSAAYQPGSKLDIKNHTPPPPYGGYYENPDPVRIPVQGLVDEQDNHQVDQMSFVLSHPPLETTAPAESESHVLTITHTINRNSKDDGGGPLLAACYLDTDKTRRYVAKIYDGFEYELAETENGADCMYRTDMDYSREAAAYEAMPARFQGSIVPRYFGSWTFPLATLPRALPASPPDGADSEALWEKRQPLDYRLLPPEHERLDVLARIIEAEVPVWWYAGVQHGDVEPRNVIISRSGPSNWIARVVIIDINAAYVLRRCERGRKVLERRALGSKLPISPIERYWSDASFSYRGPYRDWIPESWAMAQPRVSHAPALDWLVSRWKGSPDYQPPTESFLTHPAHQKLDENFQRHLEDLRLLMGKDKG